MALRPQARPSEQPAKPALSESESVIPLGKRIPTSPAAPRNDTTKGIYIAANKKSPGFLREILLLAISP